jgi:hypothetical protein
MGDPIDAKSKGAAINDFDPINYKKMPAFKSWHFCDFDYICSCY